VTDLVPPKKKLSDEDAKRLSELTLKAQKGDRKALAEASEMLTEHRLWHVVGTNRPP
jgi:endogenous inhibitor of DNA gyrase (YacG/DUF329 family)